MQGIISPELRITQISDEPPTPSFFIRFRDPVESLTNDWNYARTDDAPLVKTLTQTADVLFFQRAFSVDSQFALERAIHSSKPVVYETDDLMFDLPPQSGCKMSGQQKSATKKMIAEADVVTCSTEALAARLSELNRNVVILENYAVPFPVERVRAARAGTPHVAIVNTDYFKLIEGKQGLFRALTEAVRNLNYRVTFFGSVDDEMTRLQTLFPDRVDVKPCFIPSRRSFLGYVLEHGVNVAMVPLETSEHHRFKSDIKYLDFASIGVPGIYNNPDVYCRIMHNQTGYMCDGSGEGWLAGLSYFADPKMRVACGDAAFEKGHDRTLEHYARELAAILVNATTRAPATSAGTQQI